nr:M50 family metallopeptidase [Ferruginibacter sp.]
AAFTAGLQKGDELLLIDSMPVQFHDQFQSVIAQHKKGDHITLTVKRNNEPVQLPMTLSHDAAIGFNMMVGHKQFDSLGVYRYETRKYGFFEAFPAGVRKSGAELVFYIDQFKKILSPETGAYKGVGGFKAMGSVFSGNEWDWEHFWNMTAFFSIILAFMNLLPIPALDGGHVMFTLYEMITKRKPNEKFLEYAQIAGMIILLGLMLYANGNDWFGWGK